MTGAGRSAGESLPRVVGANLRAHRHDLGLTQTEMAERLGLHRTYMGGVERGERNITLTSLEHIAAALELDASVLVTPSAAERLPGR